MTRKTRSSRRRLELPTARVDLDSLSVERDGATDPLTPQEGALLAYLAARQRTVSRSELLQKVWGYAPQVESRAVDATVSRLRFKLEPDPKKPQSLISVRGKGYRLVCMARPPAETTLLGRDHERAQLRFLLDAHGVVQLIGRGGAGKTSLALDLVEERAVRFIDLSASRTVTDAVACLADDLDLDLRRDAAEDSLVRIVEAARRRGTPLVLDNLEQLGQGFCSVVEALHAAEVPLVLTSRTVTADAWPRIDVGSLGGEASRSLLLRAGGRVRPGWQGDPASLDRVAVLVDGLPLALELLGSQLPVVPASELETRLGSLLAVGDGRDGRHANLGASVRWSWDLLDPETQRAAMIWSCFVGPLELAALEHTLPGASALVALNTLTRAGWIDTRTPRLWSAIREFLSVELDASGGRADAERAHASWLRTHLTPNRAQGDGGPPGHEGFGVERWRDDLRLAIERATCDPSDRAHLALVLLADSRRLDTLEAGALAQQAVVLADVSSDVGLRVRARLARLEQSKRVRDPSQDDVRLAEVEALLAGLESVPELWARFRRLEGHHARATGDLQGALGAYRAAREHSVEAGLPKLTARLDHDEGATLRRFGQRDEARVLLMKSAASARALDAPDIACLAFQALTSIARTEQRLDEAADLGARAVQAGRDAADPYALGGALTNLANVQMSAGATAVAAELYREAVSVLERGGFESTLSFALGNLGIAVERLGSVVEAELLLLDALRVAHRAGVPYAAAVWRSRLAEMAHLQGRHADAEARYSAAIEELTRQAAHPQLEQVHTYAAVAAAEQGAFAAAATHLELSAPLATGSELDRAIWMLGSATVEVLRGGRVEDPLVDHPCSAAWAEANSNLATAWILWTRTRDAEGTRLPD